MGRKDINFLNAPSTDVWPTVATEGMSVAEAEKFNAIVLALKLYSQNVRGREIQERTGVSCTVLARLTRKCLTLAEDGRIFGFRAAIPYVRTEPYIRKSPIKKKFPDQKGGMAGALTSFLSKYPAIEEQLVRTIKQDAKLKMVSEYRLRPRDLHKLFIAQAKKMGVENSDWPFNTKHQGINSIQSYMRKILSENFRRSVNTRGDSAAKAHANLGGGYPQFLRFSEPYDAVEIDAYRIDSHLTVAFETAEGNETDVLLERLWLIFAVDQASEAVLSYRVVYNSQVCASDVASVIRDAVAKKWKPKKLIDGLTYPQDSGLPSGVIERAYGAIWSVTLFDGALAHLSKLVHDEVRKGLGFVINWGAVAHFERRDSVERTFGQIASKLFKRLPSTTGCNPNNGRAPNAEQNAVKHRIRAADVEVLLDLTIAQHNATPNEGLGHQSPIEYLKYFLEGETPRCLVRHLSEEHSHSRVFSTLRTAVVRGGLKMGRRPYIQLDRARYTSPILADALHLVGKALLIETDNEEEDYRYVKAYLENGAEIGFLTVQGKWAYSKHSRKTRIAINSLISKKIVRVSEFDDPVLIYLSYLSRPKHSKIKSKGPGISSKNATQAAQLSRESGLSLRIGKPDMKINRNPSTPSSIDILQRGSIMPISSTPHLRVRNSK